MASAMLANIQLEIVWAPGYESQESRDPFSLWRLGWCYAEGAPDIPINPAMSTELLCHAIPRLMMLAQDGNTDAQLCIANCLWHGRGMLQDRRQALEILQDASKQGNALAMFAAGKYHESDGRTGQAFQMYKRAATQGLMSAMTELHRLSTSRDLPKKLDAEAGVFIHAAKLAQGWEDPGEAHYHIAKNLLKDKANKEGIAEAKRWAISAAAYNHRQAPLLLKKIELREQLVLGLAPSLEADEEPHEAKTRRKATGQTSRRPDTSAGKTTKRAETKAPPGTPAAKRPATGKSTRSSASASSRPRSPVKSPSASSISSVSSSVSSASDRTARSPSRSPASAAASRRRTPTRAAAAAARAKMEPKKKTEKKERKTSAKKTERKSSASSRTPAKTTARPKRG